MSTGLPSRAMRRHACERPYTDLGKSGSRVMASNVAIKHPCAVPTNLAGIVVGLRLSIFRRRSSSRSSRGFAGGGASLLLRATSNSARISQSEAGREPVSMAAANRRIDRISRNHSPSKRCSENTAWSRFSVALVTLWYTANSRSLQAAPVCSCAMRLLTSAEYPILIAPSAAIK